MTKATIRGYLVALSLLGFSSAWAATSGAPRPGSSAQGAQATPVTASVDPRAAVLDARATRLRERAATIRRNASAQRARAAAAPPVVRVVTAPPVTQTRSS